MSNLADPPPLYSWDIGTGHECGVTGDPGKAIRLVHSALVDAPSGTAGIVRRVAIGTTSGEYVELGGVSEAWRDADSGTVVWRDGLGAVTTSDGWAPVTDEAHEIDAFAVYQHKDGTRWRAVHRWDPASVYEAGTWARLDTRCWAARIARGLRATYARTGQ